MRRSSSTERISEPSWSRWLCFCACSLSSSSRSIRAAASGRVRPERGDSRRVGVRRGRVRSGMRCAAVQSRRRRVRSSWGASLRRIGRAHRGLHGDERRRADRTCTRSEARAAEAKRRMAGAGYFASRCKGGLPPTENSRPSAIAWPGRLPPRSPSRKAVGAVLSGKARQHHDPTRHQTRAAAGINSPFRFMPPIP